MSLIDYGRVTLTRFMFPAGLHAVEPGTFLVGVRGDDLRWEGVAHSDRTYVAIALDKPQTFLNGRMDMSDVRDLGDYSYPRTGAGSMGEVAFLDERRMRTGHNQADRASDLACVLQRLIERFQADPVHEQTGFLARSRDEAPFVNFDAMWHGKLQRVSARDLPENAVELVRANGWVYASHFKLDFVPDELKHVFDRPYGRAGRLTLTGQIECIWAVLRDRLVELLARPISGHLAALRKCVCNRRSPLDWDDSQRDALSELRAELHQWSGVSDAESGGHASGTANRVEGSATARNGDTTVVLWEGAEYSERNVRLARTRTAYLECHGNVAAAREFLLREGVQIAQTTFYEHLAKLDEETPGWRNQFLISAQSGIPNGSSNVRIQRKR